MLDTLYKINVFSTCVVSLPACTPAVAYPGYPAGSADEG